MDEEIIELDDAAVKELEAAYGITPPKAQPRTEAPKAEAKAPAKVEAAPVKAPDGDLLRRVQQAEERLATERIKRVEAERLAHDRGTTVAISKAQAAESDYHAVANALSKATSDAAEFKRAHQAALEAGDYAAASDAADKMAEAKAKLVQLGDGKAALEDRVRQARATADAATKAEAPKAEVHTDPLEQFITGSGLPPKAQSWFRTHPECAPTNNKANYYKALAAHESILSEGVADGSDDYYKKLDQAMGFAVSDKAADVEVEQDDGDDEPVVAVEKAAKPAPKRVAAPVARDSIMQRRADGKVTLRLSAEQAKMADEIGMSRTNYAKYLLKAEQDGKLGGHNL